MQASPPDGRTAEIDDLWADLFQNILGAFDELGGSRYGPQWMVLAIACQLWAEHPDVMTSMWEILGQQPAMSHQGSVDEFAAHLREMLQA